MFRNRLVPAGVALALVLPAIAGTDDGLRVVALTDQQAPGLDPGITFEAIPHVSGINADGEVFFRTELAGPGVVDDNRFAWWSELDGSITMVMREGQQANTLSAGITYDHCQFASIGNDGSHGMRIRIAGPGITTQNSDGLWSDRFGSLQPIVREAQIMPGISPAETFRDPQHLWLNDNDDVAFASDSHQSAFFFGTFADVGNGLEKIAFEGDLLPGHPETVRSAFPISISNAGKVLFFATLINFDTGVWSWESGTLTPVALPDDPAPGFPGGTTLDFVDVPLANLQGEVAWRSYLSGPGITASNRATVWKHDGAQKMLIAQAGSTAVGTPGDTVFFDFPFAYVNDAGHVIFKSSLAGSTVNNNNAFGFWSSLANGGLPRLVFRQGSPRVGQAGVYGNPDFIAYDDVGRVMFDDGTLLGEGVWAWTPPEVTQGASSTVELILGKNQDFEVAPGDTRTISSVFLLDADGDGKVLMSVSFTDTSSALVVADLTFVPEPPSCPGDISGDNVVNLLDLNLVIGNFGTSDPFGDVNGDGTVDITDINLVLGNFGTSCE